MNDYTLPHAKAQGDVGEATARPHAHPANLDDARNDQRKVRGNARETAVSDVAEPSDADASQLPHSKTRKAAKSAQHSQFKPSKKKRPKKLAAKKAPNIASVPSPTTAPNAVVPTDAYPPWIDECILTDEPFETDLPPLINVAEVRGALSLLLLPDQVFEVRILGATLYGDRWPTTFTGYFNNVNRLIDALTSLGLETAQGIYLTLNPVDPSLLARAANRFKRAGKGESTTDRDIVRRHWLPVDCDPVRKSGISSTDAEHDFAINRAKEVSSYLQDHGWPEPIVADSGNGGHVLVPIDRPVADNGVVERCLKTLDLIFTDSVVKIDTTVFNPARIWKLYGTAACKGDHLADRPHRLSRILSAPK